MNKKEALIKIYSQKSIKKDLELNMESVALLLKTIIELEPVKSKNKKIKFKDLNPINGKTISHISIYEIVESASAVSENNNILFKELIDLFEIKHVFKKIKNVDVFDGVNLFVDFKKEYDETEHVWNCLKFNDILISSKKIKNTKPIKELKVGFVDFKSEGMLFIYRKPFIPGGLISRYGI